MKMRRALSLTLLAGVIAIGSGGQAASQTAEDFYRDGMAARMERRFEEAVSLLERARTLDPENADILVQLGFAQLALANNAAARQTFSQARLHMRMHGSAWRR